MALLIFLVATTITMFPLSAHSAQLAGRVVGVTDGDTLRVNHEGESLRVRLYGIDCPEMKQTGGKEARTLARRLTFGRVLLIESKGLDRYRRVIGRVFLFSGETLNRELVKAGRCWWYQKYAPDDETLAELENEARAKKLGLWAEPNQIPPWTWRRKMRKR